MLGDADSKLHTNMRPLPAEEESNGEGGLKRRSCPKTLFASQFIDNGLDICELGPSRLQFLTATCLPTAAFRIETYNPDAPVDSPQSST